MEVILYELLAGAPPYQLEGLPLDEAIRERMAAVRVYQDHVDTRTSKSPRLQPSTTCITT
jgi:hypothetical protein